MTFYKRRLTHWHPEGRSIFLTCRLHGSLPPLLLQRPRPLKSPGQRFVDFDLLLDAAATGPVWLKDPKIAAIVEDSIRKGAELGNYALHAYVVMFNHVHILLDPLIPMQRITSGLKGASARFANIALQRTGESFWQRESYDHWVRNDAQFEKIKRYIENNPVRAGLAGKPEDWEWSSANRIVEKAAAASASATG
jgi:putative transposase